MGASKYRKATNSEWRTVETMGRFAKQVADATDGFRTYEDGAWRVIVTATGKPAKAGKGGTVPFIGELAWAAADRLLDDLYWKDRTA